MKFNPDCRSCLRLTNYLQRIKQEYPDYHCAPVDSFGSVTYRLLIVGLAPGLHGANRTGRPFTGDASGDLLFETMFGLGLASAKKSISINDGLSLRDCRITNAVRCLPPQNKPTSHELKMCSRYLRDDIGELDAGGVMVALGRQAHDSILKVLGVKAKEAPFAHAAEHELGNRLLIDSYHCSRYNTQTRRLTPAMFEAVFETAKQRLASR